MEAIGGGGGRGEQHKVVVVTGGGLKGSSLIRDREGVNGQTDSATWKPAGHTPAAL